jgi:gamma-glutamyltranspeptidase/glutathione hydrolase
MTGSSDTFFRKTPLLSILVASLIITACSPEISQLPVEQVIHKSALAMPDRYSAQVSENILRAGGNAVDAAVAAGFALAVTLPEAGNIGGGGFMLVHMDGKEAFLDYREKAPLAAYRDMYLDQNGDVIENASLIGGQAAAVPGTVAGFWAAHKRYGKLPWADLVMPAAELAADGFDPPGELLEYVHDVDEWFGDRVNFKQYFGHMADGEIFRQPELAATLRRIAEQGAEDFYRGSTAKMLVDQMGRSNGLITMEDLALYEAVWREPLKSDWRDYKIVSAPPPSSGGFAVVQLLKLKDYLAHFLDGVPHNSPQYIHIVAEMEKRVFADRAEYLGDPDFVDVAMGSLLDDEYIARRAQEIDPDQIADLGDVQPGLESPDTTHFSIMDQWGNAVSNTYTINWEFGSGVVVEGAGFLLNNEMDDFSAKPGVPNIFGVVGSAANEIQPGKRPLSSMSPTILLKDGEVEIVIGTPGGSTIFTSVFQTIINMLDFGMTPDDAVGVTRFHHQLLPPDLVTYSPKRPLLKETISGLGDRGYRAEPHFFPFGDVQVIRRNGDDIQAASDPRRRGESRILTH